MAVEIEGCRTPATVPLVDDESESHYQGAADLSHLDDLELMNEDVEDQVPLPTQPPRLRNSQMAEPWPITVSEAVFLALRNSDVIRSAGQLGSPTNPILAHPDSTTTIYDLAIQQRGYLYGQRGVEAALSDFDAQFTTNMKWGREEQIQNNNFLAGGLKPGDTLASDTAQFNAALSKSLITGGQVSVSHQWNYGSNNSNQRLFTSAYDGNLGMQYRQPLLAGAGADFTRIAGPINGNVNNITGLTQGIVIARINENISLVDFELAVTRLVRDVETQYWQLVLAHRAFELEQKWQNSVAASVTLAQSRRTVGGIRSGVLEDTAAREQSHQAALQYANAHDQVYAAEAELRRLLGLPVQDGRQLIPSEAPLTAEIDFDWSYALDTALMNRPELRQQKWRIHSLDLQRQAAENLLRPQLDFVSDYHTNGFGNQLLGPRSDGLTNKGLGSAYGTLFSGQQTGWTMGVEYSVPLRRRLAKSRVQGLELQVSKAQALLRVQEVEVGHELAATFRDLDRTWLTAQIHTARLRTAEERLNALQALARSDPERASLEELMRAERAVTDARRDIDASYTEYTLAITTLHQRQGDLLAVHHIQFQDHAFHPGPIPWEGPDSLESSHRDVLTDGNHRSPGLLPVH